MQRLRNRSDNNSVQLYQTESKKLTETCCQQEVFWRQRSKQLWLREGDQNSKFFHASAKSRRKVNQIEVLKDKNGNSVSWDSGLQETMVEYFTELFKASNTDWSELVAGVETKVSNAQNVQMLAPIEEVEVKNALFSMHPDKSPDPDGMSPGFYQKFWHIVSGDIIKLVHNFFSTKKFEDCVTATNIVLIPKKQNPTNMTELRPISLCNVAYKIVSKVLANRLKTVLNSVISDNQSAFIPGRLITDNIMISYEVMHYMKRKKDGKTGWMALKLDMSKAYDRVEWGFLEAMLIKIGFNTKLVNMFMECITSAKYQIVHAGKEFGRIIPERGIRQGDPLSSYLFLICMEGFTSLIKKYEQRRLLNGIRVARGAPILSHMFFADDSYIYSKASSEDAAQIINLLNVFDKASGQKINVEKSSIFFSCNTDQNVKATICNMLKFHEANEHTTYLGLPNTMSRNKSAVLGYLKEWVRDKIKGWDKGLLSKGGNEILLKMVAQSLPNYAMSMFLFPKQLCTEIENMMSKFW